VAVLMLTALYSHPSLQQPGHQRYLVVEQVHHVFGRYVCVLLWPQQLAHALVHHRHVKIWRQRKKTACKY
jgi:hypothetical protein